MQQVAAPVNLDGYEFARDNESVMERFRTGGADLRPNAKTIFLTLVFFVLGIGLSIQFRSQSRIRNVDWLDRTELVISKVHDLEQQRDVLQKENRDLKKRIQELESTSQLELMHTELGNYRQALGLTAVVGEGVVVTLDDSKKARKAGEDPYLYLIHDSDILQVIEALLVGGAEGISVNDQRFVFSSFRLLCGGPTILVNGERVVPPFKIRAIGDPNNLLAELERKGSHLEWLRALQLDVAVEKSDRVELPAYVGNINLNLAKPLQ